MKRCRHLMLVLLLSVMAITASSVAPALVFAGEADTADDDSTPVMPAKGNLSRTGTDGQLVIEVATWSQLYELLQEDGNSIKLTSDLKYGTGGGAHELDALVVPAGVAASLDLNGHVVDRGLGDSAEAVEGGSVFDVAGALTIADSRPNAAHAPAVTFVDPLSASQETVTGGIITGGYAVSRYEGQRYFGGGGVLVEGGAHLVMSGGSICGNHVNDGGNNNGGGGGVAIKPNGAVDMLGTAAICGNVSESDGGGIFMYYATLTMDGNAHIDGNFAGGSDSPYSGMGGGVEAQRSDVSMRGASSISRNMATAYGGGLGLFTASSLSMEDEATITHNVASEHGGGVMAHSTFATDIPITMKGRSTVSSNSAGWSGGGLYIGSSATVLTMEGSASINGNRAASDGGGVMAYSSATLNTSGGTITGNTAGGQGGGVNLGNKSVLNMSGGAISGNSAHRTGGGVYAEANTTAFTLSGTVTIDGNDVVDDNGEHVADSNVFGQSWSGAMDHPITVTGALAAGSTIGITQWGVPGEVPLGIVSGFAENNPSDDPLSFFKSDSAEYVLVVGDDGEPQLALPEGVGIWIGAKRVDVVNAPDVFSDGTVSYDQVTKTLTLNGYSYEGEGDATHHAALATTVENLTIDVVGENSLTSWGDSSTSYGVYAAGSLAFKGTGSLTVAADEAAGIGAHADGSIVLDAGSLTFSGGDHALEGAAVGLGQSLSAYGEDSGSGSATLLTTNTATDPTDITALVTPTLKTVRTELFELYDLWVNGDRFSSTNLAIACGEGTAVFNPTASTPTLTLTNATITNHPLDPALNACICSKLPNLTIKTMGVNVIRPTGSGVDGVFADGGCNIAVMSTEGESGSLKLDDVGFGFNIGGTISVGGHLETTSAMGGTNVHDSAITFAKGWGYTKGASLTESGNVVIGEVVTVTFSGNGHGDILATMQVPKGKSVSDAFSAMGEEAAAAIEAKAFCELVDGGKTYRVQDYYSDPACSSEFSFDTILDEDTTLYAKWLECIEAIEISVEPPVCGTTTETVNKPVGSIADSRYALCKNDDGSWSAGWLKKDVTTIITGGGASNPYQGEFSGGASYTLWGDVMALDGYCFSRDVVVKINGVEGGVYPNSLGSWDGIEILGKVTAAHNLTEQPTAAEVPATCIEGGVAAYWTCSACGKMFSNAAGTKQIAAPVATKPLGHKWGKTTYKWSTDLLQCTATHACTREGCTWNEAEGVKTTNKVTKAATCKAAGVLTYTATFGNAAFGTQTKTKSIAALGHTWGKVAYAWSDDLSKCTATRTCTRDKSHVETETAKTTKATRQPSCTSAGSSTFVAKFDSAAFAKQTKTKAIPAKGHKPTKVAAVPATCGKAGTKAYWKCSSCGKLFADAKGSSSINTPQAVPATGKHSWNAGAVTKKPTTTAKGVRTFTCTTCGAKKTEAIPKLVLGKDGTGVGKGASASTADYSLTTEAKNDSDPKGTTFRLLRAKVTGLAQTSVTLSWTKVTGAKKYVVYGNKCGKAAKRVKIATTTGLSKKFTKVAGKKVEPETFYKFNVVALDKNDKVISTSKTVHVITKGSNEYCNANEVTVTETVRNKAKTLKKGATLKLKAKTARAPKDAEKKLKLTQHRAIAYESSKPEVATVSAKGVITAKKKGTCYVYAYAQNGVCTKVKVVVK